MEEDPRRWGKGGITPNYVSLTQGVVRDQMGSSVHLLSYTYSSVESFHDCDFRLSLEFASYQNVREKQRRKKQ